MKKILAILLAALMIFSLVACGTNDNNAENANENENQAENESESEEENKEENKEENSENEEKEEEKKEDDAPSSAENDIFKYVMDAYKASVEYNGDLTAYGALVSERGYKYGDKEEIDKDKYESTSIIAFNGNDKTLYTENAMTRADSKDESYTKTILKDGSYYVYNNSSNMGSGEPQVRLLRLTERGDLDEYTSLKSIGVFHYLRFYDSVTLAESYEELKSAMDTALIPLVTDTYVEELDGATPTVTYDISAKATDDVRTLIINTKVASEITTDGITTKFDINMYYEISAKDGKIINGVTTIDYFSEKREGEKVIEHSSSAQNIELTYEYTFAKDKYDSLEVTLPEDLSTIEDTHPAPQDYSDVAIYDIYVNGVKVSSGFHLKSCTTPQEALSYIIRQMGYEEAQTVRVFTDEAMTQELTMENVTKEKILELTTIYTEITPPADAALLIETRYDRDEYSKPYKIIMSTVYMAGAFTSGGSNYQFVQPSELQLDEYYVANDEYEIWINGVKQETKPASITLEAGKTYKIEYVTVLSENNFTK